MTIDEAIAKYKEITNTDANCPAHCNISCDKCVQESEQLAEWLEELKVYQQHEIVCHKGYNAGYKKAIDDFVEKVKLKYLGVHPDDLYEKYYPREICKQIKRLAEQLKAGVKNEINC